MDVAPRRKLIEVALPLEAINAESAREKSIRHGHPSTLHLWWARRPLAAARAVLFAQLVDDPSSREDEFRTEALDRKVPADRIDGYVEGRVTAERERLHTLLEKLVVWENAGDEDLLAQAHAEILKSTDGNPPPILDPFAGGGSIPLEAQRLGLEAHAADLNPVAVLINKALIEIPPTFAGRPPVFPGLAESQIRPWKRAEGLAADVRAYGQWIRDEAEKRIGHLYPKATLPDGSTANVIAWIWARTVTCPNPACGIEAPLANSFTISRRKGRPAHVRPVVANGIVRYEVEHTISSTASPTVSRTGATCISCGAVMPLAYVRAEGKANRVSAHLIAVIAEGERQRVYLSPLQEHTDAARVQRPATETPAVLLPDNPRAVTTSNYGIDSHDKLYTSRQLHLLTTMVELVRAVRERCMDDCGDPTYADAIAVYLTLLLGRVANRNSSQSFWHAGGEKVEQVFGRNALPMIWVYAEANPFSSSSGNIMGQLDYLAKVVERLPARGSGKASQADAQAIQAPGMVFTTDPPYYDNVPYADLSDFFYVWHRAALRDFAKDLYATVVTPKTAELIAEPARAGSKRAAAEFFEKGLRGVFDQVVKDQNANFPFAVFYAFKQTESNDSGTASTGWETMLQALLDAGACVVATWPLRTELAGGLRELGRNALASSVVLACRRRPANAPQIDRRGLIEALKNELPDALRALQQGRIAPVDLPQAAIGPGMAVFSRYSRVIDGDGSAMTVRAALARINEVLDEVISEQEGDFDSDTRFAIAWFRLHGYGTGKFGDADNLARARNASVDALARSGILTSGGDKVILIRPDLLPGDYNPLTDQRISHWEVVHHLVRVLDSQGLDGAGRFLAAVQSRSDGAIDVDLCKELAFLLFAVAEDNKWTKEAVAFNALGTSWNDIVATSRTVATTPEQGALVFEES